MKKLKILSSKGSPFHKADPLTSLLGPPTGKTLNTRVRRSHAGFGSGVSVRLLSKRPNQINQEVHMKVFKLRTTVTMVITMTMLVTSLVLPGFALAQTANTGVITGVVKDP